MRELDACRHQRRALQRSMGDRITHETRRATAQLHQQASTDPLTGLGNRRAMNLWLQQRLAEVEHNGGTLVAMAVDVDLFKPVNDVLGHEAGDACLRFLGELINSSIEPDHCAARLGGDEFLVLMTESHVNDARKAAEQLASLFSQMPWPHRQPTRPTLSIGLAHGSASAHHDVERIVRRADEALYASKRAGRCRVTVHDDGAPGA